MAHGGVRRWHGSGVAATVLLQTLERESQERLRLLFFSSPLSSFLLFYRVSLISIISISSSFFQSPLFFQFISLSLFSSPLLFFLFFYFSLSASPPFILLSSLLFLYFSNHFWSFLPFVLPFCSFWAGTSAQPTRLG